MIRETTEEDLDRMREFKVHVPLSLHLRLHRHRLLTGTSLSQTMSDALEAYFEKHLRPGEGAA